MILTYHSGFCIRAQAGDTTIVFGPVSKESKNFKPTNFGADVALISLNHADTSGVAEAGRGDKKPFVISGPGEYEIKDIVAYGFPSASVYGNAERINTIYSVYFDGLNVMYLGAHGDSNLPREVLEADKPDILIVPVGAEGTLSPAQAWKAAVALEARLSIPIAYDDKALKQFLKEAGAEDVKPEDKLTLKKKDVAGMENSVVVLKV